MHAGDGRGMCTLRAGLVLTLALACALGLLGLAACAKPAVAWALDSSATNYGNPFENGDFGRELHVGDQYFGYVMEGVTISVGGIEEAGIGPAPYDYPQVLIDYADAMHEAGLNTGYGDWGISDFNLKDVEVSENTRNLKFTDLPTTSHCCQHDNETTYDYPRSAYLLLVEEESYWSDDGSTYHAAFALMTRNLGSSMGLWDQGTAGSSFVYADWVVNGQMQIAKRSSIQNLSDGNPLYSLEGALYGVYDERGSLVVSASTDESGLTSCYELAPGTYTIRELAAPTGFALDPQEHKCVVEAGKTTTVSLSDEPLRNPIDIVALKIDADTGQPIPQGKASLAGAQFAVDYYAGYYDIENLPTMPTRSWIATTDESGAARIAAGNTKGDDLYVDDSGQTVFPLGTVVITEFEAPEGYLLGANGVTPGPIASQISPVDSKGAILDIFQPATISDSVMRGSVRVGKVDRESGTAEPRGAASLEGTAFEIVSLNDNPVIVNGATILKDQTVALISAREQDDGSYAATLDDRTLPYGTYSVREVSASPGYVYDSDSQNWERIFTITEDGQVVDLTQPEDAASNRVIRGDFSFSKVDAESMARMDSVAFLVTSTTTGESHVLVTDENGMCSTASSWNNHTTDPNGNDRALRDDGSIDDDALNPSAGVWFSGSANNSSNPDDAFGALPYDTYTVTELRSNANANHQLVEFSVTITRDSRELDLGTVSDHGAPHIGTSLATQDGAKTIADNQPITLIDTVSYVNLDVGQRYKIAGTLHVVSNDGNYEQIACEAATLFTPSESSGTIEVEFTFDANELEGCAFVAFESLYDINGQMVATHTDPTDEGQTVHVHNPGTEPEPTPEPKPKHESEPTPEPESTPEKEAVPEPQEQEPTQTGIAQTGDEAVELTKKLGVITLGALVAIACAVHELRKQPSPRE